MGTIAKIDEHTERWDFVFTYQCTSTPKGYELVCEHDNLHLGTFERGLCGWGNDAGTAASEDVVDRLDALTDALDETSGPARFLFREVKHPTEQYRECANELLAQWRQRPRVPQASSIAVAHMENPADFHRDREQGQAQHLDYLATWVTLTEEFLENVESFIDTRLMSVALPTMEALIPRWTRLRCLIELHAMIAACDTWNDDPDEWIHLLNDVAHQDAKWWYKQRDVRSVRRLER